ncbi:MAG: glucose 1-dehydrogenase [Pseudomonadota bacterium]
MGKLDGKVCLITGGARGQGAAEGKMFRDEGAIVWLADILDEEGEQTAQEIGATYRHLDVREENEWKALIDEIVEQAGKIDVLINNAGIFLAHRMVDADVEDFSRVMDINCTGVFLGMRTVANPMSAAGSGAIVNISSVAGLGGTPGCIAYGASKWAVRGMTKTAAMELSRYGVRVNSIHPGLIQTDMLDEVITSPERGERMTKAVPMRRQATAEEVAKLALFLSCDDSSYSTGSEFIVDGGMTAT